MRVVAHLIRVIPDEFSARFDMMSSEKGDPRISNVPAVDEDILHEDIR